MKKLKATYKNIEVFKDPIKILELLPQDMRPLENSGFKTISEMTDYHQGFLCGLIKNCKPKKVVEIGVSAGGTSAIIMNCLRMISAGGEDPEMYSVDLSSTYYQDPTKKCGFVAEYVKEKLNYNNFKLLVGKGTIAAHIEEIGKGIDFVILDAAHILPGEVLDFLTVLPFLKNNAMIVLHDVTLALTHPPAAHCTATRCLYSSVSGIKYYKFDNGSLPDEFSIAAFKANKSTRRNIDDVFSSLAMPWGYLPVDEQMDQYLSIIEKYYDEHLLNFLKMILKQQKNNYGVAQ